MSTLDPRYIIQREHCGYSEPRFVVRFCGDWLFQSDNHGQAEFMAESHNKCRLLSSAECAVLFRSWFNDFLTKARFAEYYSMTIEDACKVIETGRAAHEAHIH